MRVRAAMRLARASRRVLPRQRPAPHEPHRALQKWRTRGKRTTALIATKPAFADEEADVKPKRVQYGPGTVEDPGTWKIDGESISESILGTITTSPRARSAATQAQSIDQFGNIDKLDLTKLGLRGNRGNGDVVAARAGDWDGRRPPLLRAGTSPCPPRTAALDRNRRAALMCARPSRWP